jgi:hypothetical protein
VTKADDPKAHDLRDDRPTPERETKQPDPKQPEHLHELAQVDQPNLATPGIGGTATGQTTHE